MTALASGTAATEHERQSNRGALIKRETDRRFGDTHHALRAPARPAFGGVEAGGQSQRRAVTAPPMSRGDVAAGGRWRDLGLGDRADRGQGDKDKLEHGG